MYKLEGVVKEGELAQHISPVAEIWKGRYNAEEVALKVLMVYRGDNDVQKMRSASSIRSILERSSSVSDRHGSGFVRRWC